MLSQTVRNQIDGIISSVRARLTSFQFSYLAAHGHCWQGVRTPSVPPTAGATSVLDNRRRPHYQAEDWRDAALTLPAAMPFSVSVHQYVSPQGAGYVLLAEVVTDGTVWRRSVNFGMAAEDWRTRDWEDTRIVAENL